MMRVLLFTVGITIISGLEISIINLNDYDIIHVVKNHNTCSREDAGVWAEGFEKCFITRKYKSSQKLSNIVTRLTDHSKSCIKYATLECRPDYEGFILIMDKVIKMIKEYCNAEVEHSVSAGLISHAEVDKIQDLNCVENSLTKDTYATCFNSVISTYEQLLGDNETYDLIFQKEVEKAMLCTNSANKQCSNSVKIDLNKMVRYILGVKQPEKEDIKNDDMPAETPKLSSKVQKSGKENIDRKIPKFPDSLSQAVSTESPVTLKGKNEDNLKIEKLTKSPVSSKEKNSDHKFPKHEDSPNSPEIQFTESRTFGDTHEIKSEKIKNDTELSKNSELTDTAILSKTTEIPKIMESLKSSASLKLRKEGDDPADLLNSTQPMKFTESSSVKDPNIATHFDKMVVVVVKNDEHRHPPTPKTTTSTKRPTTFIPVYPRARDHFDPPRPTEPPKRWYDYITQPFVSLWRTVKSWFGF